MRRARVAVTAVAIALTSAVGAAAPASADHVADLFPDEGRCRMGGLVAGTFHDLWTTDIPRMTVKNGVITGFTCTFSDLPREFFLSPEDPEPILTVTKARVYEDFWCWRDPAGHPDDETTDARFVLTPGGRGVLTCTF